MPSLKLHAPDDGPDVRPTGDAPGADDPITDQLRALYAAPGDRYWDDLEGRIMAAVRAGGGRPGRAAAAWWQALAEWARPGLAAAAVLVVIAGSVGIQARASATNVADGTGDLPPQLELQPLDPEFARAAEEQSTDPVARAAARAAQQAADLLTGGLKRRPPVQLYDPAARAVPASKVTPGDSPDDEVLRTRREETFRYLMPD